MWAYAVAVYHDQLREAVEAYAQARHDGAIRNTILKAPAEARHLFGDQFDKAERVMTLATVRRMSTARYAFFAVAAQLRKCTVALEESDVVVPQLRDRKVLNGFGTSTSIGSRSRTESRWQSFSSLCPRRGLPALSTTASTLTGDFDTREIAEWAAQVHQAVFHFWPSVVLCSR